MYQINAITPKKIPFDQRTMNLIIDNVSKQTVLGIQADFNVTTQTWKKRPTFIVKKTRNGYQIYTTDLIYHFISGGTRVRYATMTNDFRPKTRVEQILSRKGRGGLKFISKRRPRPGIKARKYPETIGKKWNKQIPRQFQRAISAELNS